MSKYVVLSTLLLTLLIVRCAEAQQRSRTFRVGILEPGFRSSDSKGSSGCIIGFREGLRELGWIEGQSLRSEERHGEFKPEHFGSSAAELVRIAPDVIWTHSPPAVRAAKQATSTIPIVIGVAFDLVEQGLVRGNLARPYWQHYRYGTAGS